jgi:PPOX class probable F420-dependent enzyme
MMSAMPEPTFEQLAAERYVSLVTFRRNGNGVATPLWIAGDQGKLYAFTDGTSAKMKRLGVTDRIRIAACNASGAVKGEYAEGRAHRVDSPAIVERAMSALSRKYGWQLALLNLFSRLFGRIGRRAIIEITL